MKIDFILLKKMGYSLETYLCKKMAVAFEKKGIATRIICLEKGNKREYLEEDPPDWTFSFGFCFDSPQPHFIWETGNVSESLHHLKNPNVHIGTPDFASCEQLRAWGQDRVVFMPYAVDPGLLNEKCADRIYDVVLFEHLKCPEEIVKTWHEFFPEHIITLLHKIVEKRPQNPLTTLGFHMAEIKSTFAMPTLLCAIEEYLQAERLLQMIAKLPKRRIDIFGEHIGNNWLQRLKNKNIHLHSRLPYIDHFEVLKRSCMLLSSGSDEWTLPAILLGCLPAKASLEKEAILKHHTFEKRAENLLEYLYENRFSACR